MKPIPINAAREIAKRYGYDQVVVVARKVGGGEHCTTYGVDKANCDVAARIGNYFKHRLMHWTGECECSKYGSEPIGSFTSQNASKDDHG